MGAAAAEHCPRLFSFFLATYSLTVQIKGRMGAPGLLEGEEDAVLGTYFMRYAVLCYSYDYYYGVGLVRG